MFHRKDNTKSKLQDLKPDFIAKVLKLLSDSSQRGSAFPVAMGLGVIMFGVGTLSVMNSGKNKTDTIADESTKQVLAITEAGISKSISTLNQPEFRYLMMMNYDSKKNSNKWEVPTGLLPSGSAGSPASPPANPCNTNDVAGNKDGYNIVDYLTNLADAQNKTPSFANAVNGSTGSGDSAGSYEIESYTFTGDAVNGGKGTVKVRGQKTKNTSSKGFYEATFTVKPTPPGGGGGGAASLLANSMQLGMLNAYANFVICTDGEKCKIPSGSCQAGQTTLDSTNNNDYTNLKEALGLDDKNGVLLTTTGKSNENSQVQVGVSSVPPIPKAPAGVKIWSVDMSGNNTVRTIEPPTSVVTSGDTNYSLDANGNKIWFYQVNNMGKNDSLYINVTNVGENDQVKLYFNGNLDMTGSDGIMPISNIVNAQNQKPKPVLDKIKTLRILGGNADGTPLTSNQTWDLGGSSCIMGQIHAPNANFDFSNGNGCKSYITIKSLTNNVVNSNDGPNVYGTIWGNSITNKTGNSSVFFENTELAIKLAQEYGGSSYNVTGSSGTTVSMGSSYSIGRVGQ